MKTENQFVDKEGDFHVSADTTPDFVCNCDCDCRKEMNGAVDPYSSLDQCDDCDNGIHWDEIKKIYVNYEDEN